MRHPELQYWIACILVLWRTFEATKRTCAFDDYGQYFEKDQHPALAAQKRGDPSSKNDDPDSSTTFCFYLLCIAAHCRGLKDSRLFWIKVGPWRIRYVPGLAAASRLLMSLAQFPTDDHLQLEIEDRSYGRLRLGFVFIFFFLALALQLTRKENQTRRVSVFYRCFLLKLMTG